METNKDKCFFGELKMINDWVTFEANTVDDLEKNFKQSVDDYMDTCNQLNREAQKTYKGIFNVRISPELHKLAYQNTLVGKSLKEYISY